MRIYLSILLSFFLLAGQAQDKKKQDKEAIKAMCGCYEVTFEYAETFSPDTAYKFHDRKLAKGLEWITNAGESENKIVLQHLLIVGKSHVIKHWRQDWLFENQDLYTFVKDNQWQYVSLPKNQIKGQWTQKVYQVDDSPRYEGSATWVHVDGRHYWENETDAPLPRREYTTRDDYNVMRRINRHEITSYGHLHEQDNAKIIRSEAGDHLIAQEKGLNTYRKVEENRCEAAKEWWIKNQAYWKDVREAWDKLFSLKKDIKIIGKTDNADLWKKLFDLGDELNKKEQYNSSEARTRIEAIIQQFLI